MTIFQLTAAFLIRFVFTIFVIITNPRKWDTLSSLGLAGPFFRAAGSTNWKEKNENIVNDKVTFSQQVDTIDSSFGLLICTLTSENQGLEKLRSVSNPRKISGSANLNFLFQFVTWIFSGLWQKSNFFRWRPKY